MKKNGWRAEAVHGACWMLVVWLSATGCQAEPGRIVSVHDADMLALAIEQAQPGDRLQLAPGNYGRLRASRLRGTEAAPIVIESADPADPAVFGGTGVREAIKLTAPRHVTLRHLSVRRAKINGINIDDGGDRENPARGVVLEHVHVAEIGPKGNCDGIKLSGVQGFRLSDVTVEGWGGSAVDMVGCHDGVIENSSFRGQAGFSQSSALQIKGGSRAIHVRNCLMVDAGRRAINMGGRTGEPFFRPPLETLGDEAWEAADCVVEGCTIIGADTAIGFVGQQDTIFRYNTVYAPRQWLFRILQESRGPNFVPSRRGVIEHNLFVWEHEALRRHVNIGAATDPESFVFRRNAWYCLDAPERSKPHLPAEESDGLYGVDPLFRDVATGDFTVGEPRLARTYGAGAWRK